MSAARRPLVEMDELRQEMDDPRQEMDEPRQEMGGLPASRSNPDRLRSEPFA